jgi:hypothetical protein
MKLPLDPVYVHHLVNDVYDYVFVYGTGDPTGCDFDNSNNTTFDSPLYIQGNLCVSNSTAITERAPCLGDVTQSFLAIVAGVVGGAGSRRRATRRSRSR